MDYNNTLITQLYTVDEAKRNLENLMSEGADIHIVIRTEGRGGIDASIGLLTNQKYYHIYDGIEKLNEKGKQFIFLLDSKYQVRPRDEETMMFYFKEYLNIMITRECFDFRLFKSGIHSFFKNYGHVDDTGHLNDIDFGGFEEYMTGYLKSNGVTFHYR